MKLTSKMSTPQIEKALKDGKFNVEDATAALVMLDKRKLKTLNPTGPIADPAPIDTKVSQETATNDDSAVAEPAKEPKVKKERKKKEAPAKEEKKRGRGRKAPEEHTEADIYPKGTVSGMVRRMLKPKDDTKVAGCTFSEASKAVEKKHGRSLHPSEFDRNFEFMKYVGLVETKRPKRSKAEPGDEK